MARLLVLVWVLIIAAPPAWSAGLDDLTLPEGFKIEVFARVPGARSLEVVPELNTVFVGSRGDTVHAITGQRVWRVMTDLSMPNGIAWQDGWLYVAETERVARYRAASLDDLKAPRAEVIFTDLNPSRHHGWRYATFGPDGRLYVSVGAPCNVCGVSGTEATIVAMDPDGSNAEIFARGIRNSVGLAFHPNTGDLFFTDNGADWMGDDDPPEELNRADRPGLHFGYPWYGGGKSRTSDFSHQTPPADVRFPDVTFGAHVAPLGIHFYTGSMLAFEDEAIVAQHGSWNRSVPDGYRLVRVSFDGQGRAVSSRTFIEGWRKDGRTWGRPVDIAELPDGSLLVSDDKADVVYRITAE